VVFRNGAVIGSTRVAFGTVGAQIGGQTLSQIIFFQDEAVFERFRSNNLEFAANASAVAVRAGGAASAGYANGVATFAMSDGGLMANASIGGQKFTYTPR
jgi:lipid-binding SYLF domain-containing protein